MLRNLIFDLPGTLVDDLGSMLDASNLIFRRFGKAELSLEEFRERFCLPFDSFFKVQLPDVAWSELEPLLTKRFIECEQAVRLLPHAFEFLGFCQATRRRVFLLGTIKQAHVAEQLARLGVAHFFERVYTGVTDKFDRIANLLAENHLVPIETAFIGDKVCDIEMAQHGGVTAIVTHTGLDSPAKLSRANPDVMVRDLGELQKLLEAAPPNDEIRIEDLELIARVGVPEEERALPQRLSVSITLQPLHSFGDLGDDLLRTTDYAAVCDEVRRFVSGRQDKLIETLAHELAEHLLEHFDLARIELDVRKFILSETRYVAVRVARQANPSR